MQKSKRILAIETAVKEKEKTDPDFVDMGSSFEGDRLSDMGLAGQRLTARAAAGDKAAQSLVKEYSKPVKTVWLEEDLQIETVEDAEETVAAYDEEV